MSKIDKRQDRLFAIPQPTDFTWEELVYVMKHNGFNESCGGGSHYTFQHSSGFTFTMTKSHPGGILKHYQVKNAKEALHTISKLKEEKDGQ